MILLLRFFYIWASLLWEFPSIRRDLKVRSSIVIAVGVQPSSLANRDLELLKTPPIRIRVRVQIRTEFGQISTLWCSLQKLAHQHLLVVHVYSSVVGSWVVRILQTRESKLHLNIVNSEIRDPFSRSLGRTSEIREFGMMYDSINLMDRNPLSHFRDQFLAICE